MAELARQNICPDCGAVLDARQERCWLCGRGTQQYTRENPNASPGPIAHERLSTQFSLASLMLVMTLVAVCVGAFLAAPGLGVLLVLLGTPALIRTVVATNRQKRVGRSSTIVEKVQVFLFSLLVMTAVWMSAAVAFAIVCTAGAASIASLGGDINMILLIGGVGGLVSAIAMASWLLRLTAPIATPTPRFDR